MGLTEKDIMRLSPDARRRIADQIGTVALKPEIKKYGNNVTTVDGIAFDSQKEAERYATLLVYERAGMISDLRRQVKYELIPSQKRDDGKTERGCAYMADFVYTSCKSGKTIVEDVKGVRTKEYIIKRKLMLYVHGISIKET